MHAFEPHNQSFQFIPLIVISEACTTSSGAANWCHHRPGQGLLLELDSLERFAEWPRRPGRFIISRFLSRLVYTRSRDPAWLEELEERDWYLCRDLNAAETHFIHRSFLPPPLFGPPSAALLRFFLLPLRFCPLTRFSVTLDIRSPSPRRCLSNGPAITYNFMPGI